MGFREREWIHCARDPVYWVNTYGWVFEPRASRKLPFVLWEFQEETFRTIFELLGRKDILIEKSRDMGATWMACYANLHPFVFHSYFTSLFLSRNEDLVDDGSPDCLFWKLDFGLSHLPKWMRPPVYRKHLQLGNQAQQGMISGSSTTQDFARGGRRNTLVLDEFAAIPKASEVWSSCGPVANCRLVISTHKGQGTFYHLKGRPGIETITLHWTRHPDKRKGMYRFTDDGQLEILDPDYEFPDGYEFRDGNKPEIIGKPIRSPWYDIQCDRAANSVEIAQELDIDPRGSDYTFFEISDLDRYIKKHAAQPTLTGALTYNIDLRPSGFREDHRGHLRLWHELDAGLRPPVDCNYVIGVDVSSGTGTTNSVASVWNVRDRRKVAEYAHPHMDPAEFAEFCVVLGRWYMGIDDRPAKIIYEINGPGAIFRKRIIEKQYPNLWFREAERRSSKPWAEKLPGWHSTGKTKQELLGTYRHGIHADSFSNPSRDSLEECQFYVYSPTSDSIDHSGAIASEDPSNSKENHGDRVIADALAWLAVKENLDKLDIPERTRHNLPRHEYMMTLAYRRELAEQEKIAELTEVW